MRTTEAECLAALRTAAEQLGESPTKAAYEGLGLTPSSSTIIRVVGGWNEAKERAGLETARASGSRVEPKPDDVELPPELEWEELSADQRWHYRNAEWNTKRTLERRARLRAWANDRKRSLGCRDCQTEDPAVLDFHHTNPSDKEMAIGTMITYGYGTEKLGREIAKCDVLCANCHRKQHADDSDTGSARGPITDRTNGSALRSWLRQYKRTAGGCRRCPEDDPSCLVFHHSGDEKRDTIANLVSDGYPKAEIRAEIENCELLCANCHRREHFEPPQPDG